MKYFSKLAFLFISCISLFLTTIKSVHAEINNPVIGTWGDDATVATGGGLFSRYFITIWNAVISVGAIIVLVYFIWGAVEWMTSSGDKAKLESARNRMLHAAIGIFLLVTAYTIIGFISNLLFGEEFNILRPVFILPD